MKIEDAILQSQFRSPYHKSWINVVYTGNFLNHRTERILRKHGVSLPQYNILRILRGSKGSPMSLKDIKRRMLDPNPDLSRMIDRMAAANWVHRCEDPQNRRKVQVTVLEAGLALLDAIDGDSAFNSLHHESNALNADELNQLNDLLDRFRGSFANERPDVD